MNGCLPAVDDNGTVPTDLDTVNSISVVARIWRQMWSGGKALFRLSFDPAERNRSFADVRREIAYEPIWGRGR